MLVVAYPQDQCQLLSSSADANPYPSFPSPARSTLNMGKKCDEKSFGRLLESATFLVVLTLETLQLICGRLLERASLGLLQLCDTPGTKSLHCIFWGRSQGSVWPSASNFAASSTL